MPIPQHTIRSYGSLTRARQIFARQNYTPARTGGRQGTRLAKEQLFPDPPDTWRGTRPEWAIFWAHLFLRLKEGEDFEYIPRLGNVQGNVKGVQVDFMEYDLNIAIDIQGIFWHYTISAIKQFNDIQTREHVEGIGITYIAIDEDDALRDPIYYLREARKSIDHSRAARGVV
jgi:hypothetical protein